MTTDELAQAVEKVTIFAKLSPDQKARIILQIKSMDIVSLGDGINDAPSESGLNVGFCLIQLVDIAKETFVILLNLFDGA